MKINFKNYEQSCGIKPDNVEYVDPGNNPVFVFVNDPNFESIALYDIEGNIVNVNSWIECVHYINGGWAINPFVTFQGEKIIFFSLLLVSTIYTIYSIFFKGKKNYEN